MNEQTESEVALAAMNRASEQARVRAARYGSRLAVWKDGLVAFLDPETTDAEQGGTDHPATAPQSESNDKANTKPESEGRSH